MPTQARPRPVVVRRVAQQVPVIGPSAGMDLRTSPTLMANDRARTLTNWSLEEPGALVVRPGFLLFSSGTVGASRIQGGQRVYLNTAIPAAASTIFTLVGAAGSLKVLSDSGGLSAAVLSGRSTNEYFFPADRDLVAIMDGVNVPSKSTNGSSWTQMGITRPAVASTVSSKAGGSLSTSEFEVNFTYKDRDLATESNGSSTPSTVSLTSTGAIEVQAANSTDPQVDAIIVYARNKTSGESVRRKVSSFAQQGGAHSTFTITSSAWTTNDEEPTDHDVPPVLSFGVVWKNRWWARSATRTNRLYFTQLFQPQSWPALFFIDIPFERGDSITALLPLGDALLIFGATKIFVIIGQTSLDFEVRPTIGSEDGAFGPRSVAAIENGVVHASASGVYIFDGNQDRLLTFDLDPGWRDLVQNATADALARIAVAYHQQRKELRVAVPRRFPSGTDGEWILDLNRTRTTNTPAWTCTDRAIGGYINWDGPETVAGNRGRLFSWHSTQSVVYEEATGMSANSSNLQADYEGPGLTLGAFVGRWTDVRGEYEPHTGNLTIESVIDGISQGTQSVTIGAGLAVYGTATYGTGRYAGAGRKQFTKMLPVAAQGRSYVQKMTYSGQERFRIFSYQPGIQPETRSRDFSD